MADSLLTSLLNMIDRRGVAGISGALGEPEHSVSRAIESSIACALAGLAGKSEEPIALRKILDLAPGAPGDVSWSNIVSSVSDANSPLLSTGRRLMSMIFGSSEGTVMNAVSRDTSIPASKTSTLFGAVLPMIIGFIGKRVRDEGLTMSALGGMLQRETAAIRGALPAGLSDIFWPRAAATTTQAGPSPVIAQSVERERSSISWLPLIALAALIPALFWLFSHGRRPTVARMTMPPYSQPSGTASRSIPETPAPTTTPAPQPAQPENIDLRFDTGSAKLRPESEAALDRMVVVLKADPTLRLKASGYTDNVGNADRNMRLSQARAKTVIAILKNKGIASDRMTSEGYGMENPVADNGSANGRAQNRHVVVAVSR